MEPYELQEESRDDDSPFGGFDIPSEFYAQRHEMDRFELFKVVDIGPMVENDFNVGQVVLIETSMLENVTTPVGNVLFIGEPYVPIKFEPTE